MRNQFELELHQLEQAFLSMGYLVLESSSKALLALAAKDHEMAKGVIDKDKKINQSQSDIELACAQLLALQQPQVSDLRFVITIMTACSDLERMGDHMAGVSKSVLKLKEKYFLPELENQLHDMGQKVLALLSQLLDNFSKHQSKEAIAIAKEDEWIDETYYRLSKDLLGLMKDQETSVTNGTEYLAILGHLERFADYIANICERVVYLETGQIIELN
ncbi:phosphate signaling complex protein PhoU [Streptococcus ictaluri]|uniref:Phosphate-specific transport system accessory protein PhoU n=1 Tax=Streptococcus ictaluri 707-05 TaxID=764299 RepID=G5K252_9STRE|nr:phosphate signaling complex protein PhoU [Streptococcus ictaluri]EHI69939.1 phosphate transport system regulatory protein PhoU [Streptococcus ictaluri 707-05]